MNANSPIPLNVLIHEVTVVESSNNGSSASDIWDDDQEPAEHVLKRVRVQPLSKKEIVDGVPVIQGNNYLLFIDRVNSINSDGYVPQINDTVRFDDVAHKVIQVSEMYAESPEIHHWEVLLN